MMHRILTLVAALTLLGAGAATAQTVTVTTPQPGDVVGLVERIEPDQQVIVLDNGQMYRITPGTTFYVNNQPVAVSTIRPGQTVVIRSAQPVARQSGQHVVVTQPGASASPASGAPAQVVVAPPAVATPVGVRQTIYGRVDDVDDDGSVKITTDRDSFEIKMSRDLVRQLREGDTVQLDLAFVPAGSRPPR
jgi:hypothetical protein